MLKYHIPFIIINTLRKVFRWDKNDLVAVENILCTKKMSVTAGCFVEIKPTFGWDNKNIVLLLWQTNRFVVLNNYFSGFFFYFQSLKLVIDRKRSILVRRKIDQKFLSHWGKQHLDIRLYNIANHIRLQSTKQAEPSGCHGQLHRPIASISTP